MFLSLGVKGVCCALCLSLIFIVDANAQIQNYTYTSGAAGPNQKLKTCGPKRDDCSSKVSGHENDGEGHTGNYKVFSAGSWVDGTWSTSLAISRNGAQLMDAHSFADATNKHFRFKLGKTTTDKYTSVGFVLTLTGVAPDADASDTRLDFEVYDNNNSQNCGAFYHEDGLDTLQGCASGFVNTSVDDSTIATVTFKGQLLVKGRSGDLTIKIVDDQAAQFYVGGDGLRSTTGSTLATLQIVPPEGADFALLN